jgi:folate-binding protein YgfZ
LETKDDAMLTDSHKKSGIPLGPLFGVEYPTYFIHPVAEYRALTEAAGVIDLTHWRTFRLLGKDRQTFLNAMVTNDVAALKAGQGCHALLTTIKGKIAAELYVFVREEDILAVVSQGDAGEVYDVLKKHIVMDDVTIEDLSRDVGVIGLEGPKALDVLWRIFPTGPFPKEPFQIAEREFMNVRMSVVKNSASGEDGYHMLIPAKNIERLHTYIVQGSRGSDGLPVGSIAWNMRRMEKGLPWFGTDVTEESFPDEARLGATVSYTKGCFRGQETLARLHYRGHVNRVLVGLTPADEDLTAEMQSLAAAVHEATNNYDEVGLRERAEPLARALDLRSLLEPSAELFAADDESGKAVGWVTSVGFSPRLEKPLFSGYVRREEAEARVTAALGERLRLSVVDVPVV